MELQQQFNAAVTQLQELTKPPANEDLLQLYALYKQATEGDITVERPGDFDFKAIAKYDTWEDQKGKSKETAMKEYIDLMEQLKKQYT